MKARSVRLGILALVFFAVQASVHVYGGLPDHALWVCNVATAIVGIGLLIPSATVNAVGTFWLTVGLPFWILDLTLRTAFLPSTLLPHLGGIVIGYLGLRRLGLPTTTWWISVVGLGGLVLVSRAVTRPSQNVNLAYGPYSGTVNLVPSHFGQLAMTFAGFTVAFLALQFALPKLGFQRP